MDEKPRLLVQVREQIRLKHYSIRTERVYCEWIKRYVAFTNIDIRSIWGRQRWKPFFLTSLFAAMCLLQRRTRRLPRCCFFISRCLNRNCPGWVR